MEVKKNINFWIGRELEGKFKGIKTLFIKDSQPIKLVKEKLKKRSVSHLYFGAGDQSMIDCKVVKYFLDLGYLVTIDIRQDDLKIVPEELIDYENLHIMVTFNNKFISRLREIDSIKIDGFDNVAVSTIETMSKTNKSSIYVEDEYI